jgi:hypothetical protein
MKDTDFEKQMENLKTPDTGTPEHQQILKITILSATKSSRAAIIFIILPCLFLIGVFIKYKLGIDLKIFSTLEEIMAESDKSVYLKWISPLILVGLPLIGVVLNAVAITHFFWNRVRKELIITIKYRLANIILLILSAGVASVFVLYVIVENIHHRP